MVRSKLFNVCPKIRQNVQKTLSLYYSSLYTSNHSQVFKFCWSQHVVARFSRSRPPMLVNVLEARVFSVWHDWTLRNTFTLKSTASLYCFRLNPDSLQFGTFDVVCWRLCHRLLLVTSVRGVFCCHCICYVSLLIRNCLSCYPTLPWSTCKSNTPLLFFF